MEFSKKPEFRESRFSKMLYTFCNDAGAVFPSGGRRAGRTITRLPGRPTETKNAFTETIYGIYHKKIVITE
jgi:hypothetical protein